MNIEATTFVKPSPKPELSGKLGLYTGEIARSLGVPPTKVREKLRTRDFLSTLENNNFAAVPFRTLNKSNGLGYQDYCLEVAAAKFFVARWNNDLGAAYLTYLVRLESEFEHLNSEFYRLVDERMEQALDGKLFDYPSYRQLFNVTKEALRLSHSLRSLNKKRDSILSKIEVHPTLVSGPSIKIEGIASEDLPDVMLLRDIARLFFRNISPHVVSKYLRMCDHPRANPNSLKSQYITEGMKEASERFFNDSVKVQGGRKTFHHPKVGRYRIPLEKGEFLSSEESK